MKHDSTSAPILADGFMRKCLFCSQLWPQMYKAGLGHTHKWRVSLKESQFQIDNVAQYLGLFQCSMQWMNTNLVLLCLDCWFYNSNNEYSKIYAYAIWCLFCKSLLPPVQQKSCNVYIKWVTKMSCTTISYRLLQKIPFLCAS